MSAQMKIYFLNFAILQLNLHMYEKNHLCFRSSAAAFGKSCIALQQPFCEKLPITTIFVISAKSISIII